MCDHARKRLKKHNIGAKMHIMNWDDMRFFLALCREGSVTGAGRSLGVNHTTVARRIKALEAGLATRLFDHLRDGYEMTQAAGFSRFDRLEIDHPVNAFYAVRP